MTDKREAIAEQIVAIVLHLKKRLLSWKQLISIVEETQSCLLYSLRKQYIDLLLTCTAVAIKACSIHPGSTTRTSDIDIVIDPVNYPLEKQLQTTIINDFSKLFQDGNQYVTIEEDDKFDVLSKLLEINFFQGTFTTNVCGAIVFTSQNNYTQRYFAFTEFQDAWKTIYNFAEHSNLYRTGFSCITYYQMTQTDLMTFLNNCKVTRNTLLENKGDLEMIMSPCPSFSCCQRPTVCLNEYFRIIAQDMAVNLVSKMKLCENDSYKTLGSYLRWVTYGYLLKPDELPDESIIPIHLLLDCYIEQICIARKHWIDNGKVVNNSVKKYMSRAFNTHTIFIALENNICTDCRQFSAFLADKKKLTSNLPQDECPPMMRDESVSESPTPRLLDDVFMKCIRSGINCVKGLETEKHVSFDYIDLLQQSLEGGKYPKRPAKRNKRNKNNATISSTHKEHSQKHNKTTKS
jgi:hypothetical protein